MAATRRRWVVGASSATSKSCPSEVVPAEEVQTELVRIGNDGPFFDEADDDSGEFTCILTGEAGQNLTTALRTLTR
ncbi:hypothetical protein ACVBEQ_25080 [Nakamurella sp. GG22]